MNKKNDKRLCWNCDGDVSRNLSRCPYCGVDLSSPQPSAETPTKFVSPFQKAYQDESVPKPPYQTQDFSVTKDEWNRALEGGEDEGEAEQPHEPTRRKEIIALLLLIPGVVFLLFGLALTFFSHEGTLTLQWNQSFAAFYYLGAIPLLILGWRALR